jgi:hypothetical protein
VFSVLGDNTDTIKRSTGTLNDAKEGGWSKSKSTENEVLVDISAPECRSKSWH